MNLFSEIKYEVYEMLVNIPTSKPLSTVNVLSLLNIPRCLAIITRHQ